MGAIDSTIESRSDRPAIPESGADLNPAWFNTAAALAGANAGPHEPGLAAMDAIEVDASVPQGFMGSILRVRPRYAAGARGAKPDSLIVKLSSSHPAMRQRQAGPTGYAREVGFYQDLADRVGPRCPACWYADVDVDRGFHVLVLEDLSHMQGGVPRAGCSEEQAQLAVSTLAGMHARWWENPQLDEFGWLPDSKPSDPEVMRHRLQGWWPEFIALAGSHLDDGMLAFGKALPDSFAQLLDHLAVADPRTLRHGDYGLSNLLFSEHETEDIALAVIDWQMVARGKGVWDLAWFLGQSLTVAQRRRSEPALLTLYHERLVAGGVRDYSLDACQADYRVALAQRFGTLISSLVALPFTAQQKAEILDVQLPRNVAAVLDHGGRRILETLG